jgi:hypothetical protein
MHRLTIIGIVLVVLGLLGFIFPRIALGEERTSIVDLGPLQIEATEQRLVTIPDIAAAAAVGVGTVLIVVGATRRN